MNRELDIILSWHRLNIKLDKIESSMYWSLRQTPDNKIFSYDKYSFKLNTCFNNIFLTFFVDAQFLKLIENFTLSCSLLRQGWIQCISNKMDKHEK